MKLKDGRCCKFGGLFHPQWPLSWAQITLIGIVLTFASILSSFTGIVYFGVKLHQLQSYNYLYSYQLDQCNLQSSSVYEYQCSEGTRYIVSFLDSLGRKAVENPFAWRRTKILAENERRHFSLPQNQTCMCREEGYRSGQDCQSWPRCILDEDFVLYMQRDNQRYQSNHIRFIIVSTFSLVLSCCFLPISFKTLRKELGRETYVEL